MGTVAKFVKRVKSAFGFGGSKHAPGSRAYARELLTQAFLQSGEAYRLARRDRPSEHFQPQHFSGTGAAMSSSDMMTRRARDLVRNTAQAKRINQILVDLIVGTGIQTFSWPFAPAELFQIVTELEDLAIGALGPRLSFALESDDLFEEWSSDPKQFDAEGRLSRDEMERMLLGDCIQVGTGLMIRTRPTNYKLVPLAYQLIEQEQIDLSQDRVARPGQNKIVAGREFDESNRIVAYHVYIDHPYDSFGSAAYRRDRIPADRVIDLAIFHRPSAAIGVSWLDAIGQSVFDRESYTDSEIRAAAMAAVFTVIHKLNDPEVAAAMGFDDGTDSDTDDYGNEEVKLGHSPVATRIGKDESVEIVNSARPNATADSFLGILDRDIACGGGISYYSLTGNYQATSFSSTRAAKLDEDLHILPMQKWFATHVALPVRRQFNSMAAAAGLFSSLRPAQYLRDQRTFQRFDAIGNGRDILDPGAETTAKINKLRSGLSTLKEECARNGKHWIRVLMQRAIEQSVAGLFDVPLDYSLGGGASSPNRSDTGSDGEDSQAKEKSNAAA